MIEVFWCEFVTGSADRLTAGISENVPSQSYGRGGSQFKLLRLQLLNSQGSMSNLKLHASIKLRFLTTVMVLMDN